MNILVVIEMNDLYKQKMIDSCVGAKIDFMVRKEVTIDTLNKYDALIGNLTPKLLKEATNLKWVHLESAGAERYLDIPSNILLTNSTGAYGEAIAEYLLAGIFTIYKRFDEYIKAQHKHNWEYLGKVKRVSGSKVLVVGLGNIGLTFAKKMNSLGAIVYGVKRTIKEMPEYIEDMFTLENINNILGEVDIVVLSLPYTKETDKFFDYKQFKMMKKDSVLLNVGRGKTVDTDGLIKALEENHFLGVCLDVLDPEPLPVNSKLWEFENVIITPHVSGNYSMDYTFERVLDIAKENINKFINNEKLINEVDRNLGYKKNA